MYQAIKGLNQSEENFNNLYEKFCEMVFNMEQEVGNSSEFDLSATYEVNHICSWNKYITIGAEVKILQKNDKVAIVKFAEQFKEKISLINCIFRLEDLSVR